MNIKTKHELQLLFLVKINNNLRSIKKVKPEVEIKQEVNKHQTGSTVAYKKTMFYNSDFSL